MLQQSLVGLPDPRVIVIPLVPPSLTVSAVQCFALLVALRQGEIFAFFRRLLLSFDVSFRLAIFFLSCASAVGVGPVGPSAHRPTRPCRAQREATIPLNYYVVDLRHR